MSNVPHIAIFGGGFAGTKLFIELNNYIKPGEAEITLINQWPFLYYDVAVPRSLVDPVTTPVEKLLYPLKPLAKSSHQHVVIGSIEEILEDHAIISRALESGAPTMDWFSSVPKAYVQSPTTENFKLKFDYAIIALGSQYTFPGKIPSDLSQVDIINKFKQLQTNIKEAKKILILGGGPVGIEIAGEIKTDFPEKSVTIASTSLFSLSSTFLTKLKAILDKKNIQTILNSKLDLSLILEKANATSFPIILPSPISIPVGEKQVEADLIIKCTGTESCSSPVKIPNVLNEKGWIKVNPFLQVEGQTKLFAIGDAASTSSGKFAFIAMQQADNLAQNLSKLIKAKDKSVKLKPFSPPPPMCILSIGRDDGVSQLPVFSTFLGSRFAKFFKGDGGFMTARNFFGPSLMDLNASGKK